MTPEFSPDWCIAPGVCLEELLRELGLSPRTLAASCAGPVHRDEALVLIEEVLARKPLTQAHADLLARAPIGPSAQFWLHFETNYRNGLAAGLHDTSG